MKSLRTRIINIIGNFGISFFAPFVGVDVGPMLFHLPAVDLGMALIIALISALFVTGMSISREMADYGVERKKRDG